jgi:serine/threonine protein kinase
MDAISITEFELISQIGRGTYAKVILARFKPDSKLYALKILNKKHIIAKGQ